VHHSPGPNIMRDAQGFGCARACVNLRGWAVASELAGVTVGGVEGVLEVENVEGLPGAAVCSLLLASFLISSPSSKSC
jgi:hypothetical protein